MQARLENLAALRQEICSLLHEQIEALDSPQGLTHEQLRECYVKQARVLELRERLQAASNPRAEEIASQALVVAGEMAGSENIVSRRDFRSWA